MLISEKKKDSWSTDRDYTESIYQFEKNCDLKNMSVLRLLVQNGDTGDSWTHIYQLLSCLLELIQWYSQSYFK